MSDEPPPIVIVPYDPEWPSHFEAERGLLVETLSEWLVADIEHVGSTAVVGLCAKPVVDIMVPVAGLEESKPAIAAAESVGYRYYEYKTDVMHWHCKYVEGEIPKHLHMVPYNSPLWADRLAFRDALRDDPALAEEYATLKTDLAVKFRTARDAYTEAKSPFVRRVLASVSGS